MDLVTFLTALYVYVDDWYKANGEAQFKRAVGRYARCPYLADGGFNIQRWAEHWQRTAHAAVLSPPPTRALRPWHHAVRQVSETVFALLSRIFLASNGWTPIRILAYTPVSPPKLLPLTSAFASIACSVAPISPMPRLSPNSRTSLLAPGCLLTLNAAFPDNQCGTV